MAVLKPVIKWRNRIRQTLERERVVDAQYRTDDSDPDNPFWSFDEIEALHVEISQQLIRMTPRKNVGELGTLAVKGGTYVNGDAIDPKMVRVIGAGIAATLGGLQLPATGPIGAAQWYQAKDTASRVFAVIGNKVYFNGTTLGLLYTAEPSLADFQSDALQLPATGTLEMANDWVHQQCQAANGLMHGRV